MRGSSELMRFQVQNKDARVMFLSAFRPQVPFRPGLQQDELSVRNHTCSVHRDRKDVFEEHFTCGIDVDHTVLPETSDSEENVGIVKSRVKVEYFSVLFGKVDFARVVFEEHL